MTYIFNFLAKLIIILLMLFVVLVMMFVIYFYGNILYDMATGKIKEQPKADKKLDTRPVIDQLNEVFGKDKK